MSTSKPVPNSTNKPHSVLPFWMRQSLDHLSMRTNFDDYGTSPPENESLFLHESKLQNHISTTSALSQKPGSVSSEKASSLVFKTKELAPRAPRSALVADQVCPNSAPQSATTTPSVSPQQSPTLIRKILSADSQSKAGSLLTDGARKVLVVPVTRVTNFDLNAVSPTSW